MSSPKNANIKKIILYLKVAKIDFACPSTDSKEVVYPLVSTMLVPLHITYIVTDRRAIYMFKFLYLHTNEIPVGRIVQISEKRTLIEALTGRGTVVVSSGIGSRMTISMEEIDNPGSVAEALRSMLPSTSAQ